MLPKSARFGLALGAALLLAPSAHAGNTARVHLQAPVKLSDPAQTDLNHIETYGQSALWSHDFSIPYALLEAEIAQQLADRLVQEIGPSGYPNQEVCDTKACPDVHWRIDYGSSFAFTDKNEPTLTKVGPSSHNRIEARLTTRAKAQVYGTLHAKADVPVPMPVGLITETKHVDVPFNLFVEVELKAKAGVKLWPTLTVTGPELEITITEVSPNIEIGGQAADLGAQVGILIGNTPLGLMGGGPLTFSTLLMKIGNEAADRVEAYFESYVETMVREGINGSLAEVEQAVRDAIAPTVKTANTLKNNALGTTLPGVGKSIEQLTASLGASMEVHTVTPNGGIALSGVMRMASTPGKSQIDGVARVSSQACMYGQVMGQRLPIGTREINTSLESKVGQACSSAFSGVQIQRQGYRGANPQTALGPSAEARSSWTSTLGQMTWQGTMTKHDGYYQCGFSASGLPDTSIVELTLGATKASGLAVDYPGERFLAQKVPGKTLVFEHDLDPTNEVVLGGAHGCGSAGGGIKLRPNKAKELEDFINNCPECTRELHLGNDVIYELSGSAFKNSAIGKHITSVLQQQSRTQASAKANAKASAKASARTH
ncbi:MAG: hypothetical protein AAGF11_14970 [Myxococcota bacterium]